MYAKKFENVEKLKECKPEGLKLDSLKKNYQFQKVYKHGKSVASKTIILYFKRNGTRQLNLGISISKKIGNSVQRHRLKRIYKEAFRQLREKIKDGYDFIIVARKGTAKTTYHEAVEELTKTFNRGKIIK